MPAWRPAQLMSDAELLSQCQGLTQAEDQSALRSPVALAHHLEPAGYKRRRHLNLIGQEMQRIASGEIDRLLILCPPQTGKTETAVIWGAFWWLCRNPGHRVIIGSYGNSLAVKRGAAIKRRVEAHGDRYGLALQYGSTGKADWRLTSGGGVKSVGVGGGIVGEPGDAAFLDDPHKSRQEADSLVRRDWVADWYSGDILTRLSPGAPIVLILTRWHPDDIAGRLIEAEGLREHGGRWQLLRMPALCDDPDRDPLGRQRGDPLPHPKVKPWDTRALLRHWAEKRATVTIRDWNAQYQADPQPQAGALLTEAQLRAQRWFGDREVTAAPRIKAVAVDPAGGGRDTVGVIAGWLGDDNRLYITDDWTDVMPADQWGRRVCELAAQTEADRIIVEADYGGDMCTMIVRTAWETLRREERERLGGDRSAGTYKQQARYNRPAPRIVPVRSTRGKLLRAEPIAVYWTSDRIRTTRHLPDLEQEWATWQPTDPDSPGRIDASVHLAWALVPTASGQTEARGGAALAEVDLTSQLRPGQMGGQS